MVTPLATRLPVYVLRDLAGSCPSTLHALDNWLDQTGFWLADIAQHPKTPDQDRSHGSRACQVEAGTT